MSQVMPHRAESILSQGTPTKLEVGWAEPMKTSLVPDWCSFGSCVFRRWFPGFYKVSRFPNID